MVASETYAEFLREQLAPLGGVTLRRMFGKSGVFCDGVMLGVVTENTLYFRVDDENRVTFREAEAFPPLNYAKKGSIIDLSFWRVPRWPRHTGLRRRGQRQSSVRDQVRTNVRRERPEPSGCSRGAIVALRATLRQRSPRSARCPHSLPTSAGAPQTHAALPPSSHVR